MSGKPALRVGTGFDFHPFEAGRALFLGGVRIPHDRGLRGHSDADVLLHALADAMLGAAGLPDIGHFFPDTDPAFRGMPGLVLLGEVVQKVRQAGFLVGNVDVVVLAEAPRIMPHVEAMKSNIARCLGLDCAEIGIKATTMEGKGAIGRGEGIAAQAVVLLVRSETFV